MKNACYRSCRASKPAPVGVKSNFLVENSPVIPVYLSAHAPIFNNKELNAVKLLIFLSLLQYQPAQKGGLAFAVNPTDV
ncbi:hypothetical protein [Enterobacter mori]|uniref:hypothetical protein n=1 Tax=Enterobacter mori TaxID=539813 RepID=UPI003B842F96